eukprot:403370224
MKELLPGQPCQQDYQCLSKRCKSNKCIGGYGGDPCKSVRDCHSGYYCKTMHNNGVYYDICSPKKSLGDACAIDQECPYFTVCSTPNKTTTPQKTCLQRWQYQDAKPSEDKRLCANNTLNDGACTGIEYVYQFNDGQEQAPWPCRPQWGIGYCTAKYTYAGSTQTQQNDRLIPCQCSLFNQTEGYCQWPGQEAHKQLYQFTLDLYKQSTRCHQDLIKDDPLDLDLFQIYQCSDLNEEDFQIYYAQWIQWKYWAPIQSTQYNKTCLDTIVPQYETQIFKLTSVFQAFAIQSTLSIVFMVGSLIYIQI